MIKEEAGSSDRTNNSFEGGTIQSNNYDDQTETNDNNVIIKKPKCSKRENINGATINQETIPSNNFDKQKENEVYNDIDDNQEESFSKSLTDNELSIKKESIQSKICDKQKQSDNNCEIISSQEQCFSNSVKNNENLKYIQDNHIQEESKEQINEYKDDNESFQTISHSKLNIQQENYIQLENLPTEMVEEVLQYLSSSDIISCSSVCKSWHMLLDNATIWRNLCRKNKWSPLNDLCAPCPLNSDLCQDEFTIWKQCYLEHSRIKNNWMEGNFWQQIIQLDSNYTNVISNGDIILTWFFIQDISIYKVINHNILKVQSFQPVLKRRPIDNIIINNNKNAFLVIQYGLLQYYQEDEGFQEMTKGTCHQFDEETLKDRVDFGQHRFVLKFCKSFDVDENNIDLSNRPINSEFHEWYERNVIRSSVNLKVLFNQGNLLFTCELERKIMYIWQLSTSKQKAVINIEKVVKQNFNKVNPIIIDFKLNKTKLFISIQLTNTLYLILVFCQKTFQLLQQIKTKSFQDFYISEKYLVIDLLNNIRYLQIWNIVTFEIVDKKCKINGDNEKRGELLLIDDDLIFHKENNVVIYDILENQSHIYPIYKIGSICNIVLAPYNLFLLEYYMSDRKYVFCLYDRVTYRWVVKKFIITFQKSPKIIFSNLTRMIVKEFNRVHYLSFW